MKTFYNFMRDESGATAIEYALIAALISIAAIATLRGVGTQVNRTFQTVNSTLAGAR